jgi:membrane associated rhomboid family serine protease
MKANQTFWNLLVNNYRYGGTTMRLIYLNAAIFLIIQIVSVFGRLILVDNEQVTEFLNLVFSLNTEIVQFLYSPWGIVTSIFSHFSLWHLLFNMLFIYFSGRMFEQLFDSKRLWYTYILGGLFGSIFELTAHIIFPGLQESNSVIVGASGSIMAIFMALAFYRPNLTVQLFGIFPLRIIYLALFFLISDIVSLGLNDGIAHFAHLGGAFFGFWSVRNANSQSNVISKVQKFINYINSIFKSNKSKNMRSNTRMKTDEEYNFDARKKQEKIDQILDKISKSGYESLTRQEKDFLFNQSKND